jgi:hypothetical protein
LGIETGDLYGKLNGSIHGAETALLHSGVVHGSKGKFGFKYERLAEWCQMFGNCAYVALRVLERCIDMWEQRKRDRLMCWTCHSLGTFSVVATISMMDQDFTSVRCGNCGNEQTYIAQHIRDCGIR